MDEGYNPAYGARPLRRAIMRLLEDSMAERMLAGDIKARPSIKSRHILMYGYCWYVLISPCVPRKTVWVRACVMATSGCAFRRRQSHFLIYGCLLMRI